MTELLAEETAIPAQPIGGAKLSRASALLATLVTALWGTNPAALKIAMRALPPLGCSGIRFAIAAVGVWAWCKIRKVPAWPQPGEGRWLAVTAAFFIVQIATFTLGVYWGTAGHSIVLLHTYPFFVVALAHFLIPGESASAGKVAGLVAAFAGIVVLFAGEWGSWQGTQLRGDSIQLFSAVVLAAQVVFLKHAVARADANRVVLWQMVAGSIAFLVYSFWVEGLTASRPGWQEVATVIYQGVVIGALCFTVWTWLIEKHAASRVAIFGFIAPLVGVALSVALGEALTPSLLVSAALVAAGIVFANRF
jgi:drug/metabolite transporter (DMT)-like permease